MGRCRVENAAVLGGHIRGDELKGGETIHIENSLLLQSLIHHRSHRDPPGHSFIIKNTVAMPFANIHGSSTKGCYFGPFSTLDLTRAQGCHIGTFAYVQADPLEKQTVEDGRVLVREKGMFEFDYLFPGKALNRYVRWNPQEGLHGIFTREAFRARRRIESRMDGRGKRLSVTVPETASANPYAWIHGKTVIGQNVFVSQGACLNDVMMGYGSNAQENCVLSHCRLEGKNVTAHGARLFYVRLEKGVFTGFNAFLRGTRRNPLRVGEKSILMPHTIIESKTPLSIPPGQIVWGLIRKEKDLSTHSLSLKKFSGIQGELRLGSMKFSGSGKAFVDFLQKRIHHILEGNGAFFGGEARAGHAQNHRHTVFQILRPVCQSPCEGILTRVHIQG